MCRAHVIEAEITYSSYSALLMEVHLSKNQVTLTRVRNVTKEKCREITNLEI